MIISKLYKIFLKIKLIAFKPQIVCPKYTTFKLRIRLKKDKYMLKRNNINKVLNNLLVLIKTYHNIKKYI